MCSCVAGPIDYRHAFVDMPTVQVQASNWTQVGKTCKPAMGFGFAAGTTDGGFDKIVTAQLLAVIHDGCSAILMQFGWV